MLMMTLAAISVQVAEPVAAPPSPPKVAAPATARASPPVVDPVVAPPSPPPPPPAVEAPSQEGATVTEVAPPPPPDPVTADQGDVVVTGRKPIAGDPLRAVNAQSFAATQAVDGAVIGPVARVYKRKVPSPLRSGIHNFLYNLREPVVFVNFLLQFKPGKAAETAGRFVVNSTVGVAGVFDMAKRRPFRLPRRSNGFANTLGYHGVKNGPFLFLPLVGPTTVRDLVGGTLDRLLMPAVFGKPFTQTSYTAPAGVLGALDHRAEFDETLKCLHDDGTEPYAASRAFYLYRRQAEIDHLHRRPSAPPPNCEAFLPVGQRSAGVGPTAAGPAPADVAVPPPPRP